MLWTTVAAVASIAMGGPPVAGNSLELAVPSICTLYYGETSARSADWVQIAEETDDDGNSTPIYTSCRPA